MPVFRIDILFANRKRYKGYHNVDGVELDTYYRRLFRLVQKDITPVISFDVVQISEFSREATFMRNNNLKRMLHMPNIGPKQRTGRRTKRL